MIRQVEQISERIKLITKKNGNTEKRIEQSSEQSKKYEPQIEALKKLLDAGNIKEADFPDFLD